MSIKYKDIFVLSSLTQVVLIFLKLVGVLDEWPIMAVIWPMTFFACFSIAVLLFALLLSLILYCKEDKKDE